MPCDAHKHPHLALSRGLFSCPECPWTPESEVTKEVPTPCMFTRVTQEKGSPSSVATAAWGPKRAWLIHLPAWNTVTGTFLQTQNPHGVQGVDEREAEAEPLAEGPGHRLQFIMAPGELAVPGPGVAEGIYHGLLALIWGAWKEKRVVVTWSGPRSQNADDPQDNVQAVGQQ